MPRQPILENSHKLRPILCLEASHRIGNARILSEFWHTHGGEETLSVLWNDQCLNIPVLTGNDAVGVYPHADTFLPVPWLSSVLIAQQARGTPVDAASVDLKQRHINVLPYAQPPYA